MEKKQSSVTNRVGRALEGASVAVYNDAGVLATIYADNETTTLTNPLTTDALGAFGYKAADGVYSWTISHASITTKTLTEIQHEDPLDSPSPTVAGLAAAGGAATVGVTPTATLVATNAQTALAELDTKKVAAADLAADAGSDSIGHIASGTGAVATTVWAKLRESVSVKDFGAVGDGVADDTAAIQAAYDYVSVRHGILQFPLGNYICSGLDLGSGVDNRACSFVGQSHDFLTAYLGDPFLDTFPVSKITLKNGSNRPLFRVIDSFGWHKFENLLLLGNKDNQTTPAYVVHLDDTASYKAGIRLKNVHIQGGSGGGLYIGLNRGSNHLDQVGVRACGSTAGHHGIYVNCYDTYISDAYLGASSGYNLYIDNASQVYLLGINSFEAAEGGVYVSQNCNGLYWAGGSLDHSEKVGLYLEARNTGGGYEGYRFFSGVRFVGNSNSATNTHSDVYVSGLCTDAVFSDCGFQGPAGTGNPQPKYFFEFANTSSRVRLIGCKLDASDPGTAVTNNWPSIQSDDVSGFTPQMNSATTVSFRGGNEDLVTYSHTTNRGIGFGGSGPFAGVNMRNVFELKGSSTARSFLADGPVQSDVTANAWYWATEAKTANASFTLASLAHYYASQGTFGASSAVTSQFGFQASTSLIGATNNFAFHAGNTAGVTPGKTSYAFFSGINTATGGGTTWQFYANGTAPNYFAGDFRFDKTVTAGGTTGDQTINKNSGAVNFAGGASSLTVTNSRITTGSVIVASVATNDATMKSVSVIAGAGSFVIQANAAATAETRINWVVLN